MALGIERARHGTAINRIGRAVEDEARRHGAHVVRELGGHGIGRHIHEKPSVQNYCVRGDTYRLPLGLVFTIEPTWPRPAPASPSRRRLDVQDERRRAGRAVRAHRRRHAGRPLLLTA